MYMLLSRAEIVGWFFACLVIVGMGFMALHGSFNSINHARAAAASATTVKIVTNAKTIGAYQPAKITLKVGQSATFINVSNADHTVSAHNGSSFDSGNIATGASWVFKATKPGTYPYICQYHPLMKGTIVITA
jgi:plastocyanin